jgi:FkbM family methyltransferase
MNIINFVKPLIEKFPWLANFYRYNRNVKSLNSKIKFRDHLGFYFNGNSLMEKGEFEPEETFIFDQIINSFDTFINIGANTGYYVCKALKKKKRTLAFEPNQLNVNILLKNIEANNFKSDFQLFPVALSDKEGTQLMYGESTGASLIKGWAGQKNSTLVPVSVFDKITSPLIKKQRCFVIIDIEGSEFKCLNGAKSLLSSKMDNIFLIEISVKEHQPNNAKINPYLFDTFNLMKKYGYSAYTADSSLRKIELREVKKIQISNLDTLGIKKNFIFSKNSKILKEIKFF